MIRFFAMLILQAVLVFSINGLARAMDCPENVAEAFPACKDAVVKQTMNVNNNTIVVLQSDKDPASVYDIYKKQAEASGCKVVVETKQDNNNLFVGERDDKRVMFNVIPEDGQTMVRLSVGKR